MPATSLDPRHDGPAAETLCRFPEEHSLQNDVGLRFAVAVFNPNRAGSWPPGLGVEIVDRTRWVWDTLERHTGP